MKRVYLASPYSHSDSAVIKSRVDMVAAVCARINERGAGINCYSPIVHGHHLPHSEDIAKNDAFWRPFNEDEIRRSDEVWVLTIAGWDRSIGVTREIAFANLMYKPVRYIDALGSLLAVESKEAS